MKKIFIITLLTILSIPTTALRAETKIQEVPTRQNILRERLEKQRVNYFQNLEEARTITEQYRKAETPAEKEELRELSREGFLVRLMNAVDKLAEMQDRVEDRIILADSKGFDTTESRAQLNRSRVYLENINTEMTKLRALFVEQNKDEKEIREIAQLSFSTIKENFHLSRQELLNSIESLKTMSKKVEEVKDTNSRPTTSR